MLKILPPTQIKMPSGLSFEGDDLNSIIKWQTRTDWLTTGVAGFATEEIVDTRKLYERNYQLDMHRWIARHLATAGSLIPDFGADSETHEKESVDVFKPMIQDFANKNGDFFTNDVTADTTEQTIRDWFREWEFIGSWEFFREDESFKQSDLERVIQRKLNDYTGSEIVARRKGSNNYDVAIRPKSWTGWCWALIARDFYDEITYKLCINFENCGHEVPSLTLKGNSTNKCSEKCRKAAYRKRSSS